MACEATTPPLAGAIPNCLSRVRYHIFLEHLTTGNVVHTYVRTYIRKRTHMHVCIKKDTTDTYIRTVHMYVRMHACVCVRVCVCVHKLKHHCALHAMYRMVV